MKKTRVKIVCVREEPDTPCWPCINHDADQELRRITAPIFSMNPDMAFDVISYTSRNQAEADYKADLEKYDGVLVLLMTCWKGIDNFYAEQSVDGIPTIIADVPYCGSGSLLMRTVPLVRGKQLPVPVLSTLNYNEIAEAVKIFDVITKMKQTVILVITNAERARKKALPLEKDWQCRFVYADSSVFMEYMEKTSDEEAQVIAHRWITEALEVVEPTEADIVESARVHIALREMMKAYGAQAVTVDCLELSYGGEYGKDSHFYPCLSHFEMLEQGTIAVCEADVNATVTSLVLSYLTGKSGFVSDPAIDTSSNQIIYAHCVGCRKAYGCEDSRTCQYVIRSHAEDKKGASVQIIFPAGEKLTTTMIYPGAAVIHNAKSVGNVGLQEACRTKLAAETNAESILNHWGGSWHRVTVFGDYRKLLKQLYRAKGLRVIEEDRD